MRRRPPIATRTDTLLPDTTLFRSLREPTELTLEISGRQLLLEPVQRDGDRVHVGDFYPCSVLLNNDLSAGIPDILKGITQDVVRSEEHTSELQSLMRISYAVFCLKKKTP